MRIVAKIQFTAPSTGVEVAERIGTVLDRWAHRKFETTADGGFLIRHSGLSAVYDKRVEEFECLRRDTLTVLEPVDGGNLQTEVDILAYEDRTAFRCVLSIGSDSGVSPANVPLRAPRFIHETAAIGVPWTIGQSGERVFAHSFNIDVDDVCDLEALMFAPERRLPIVVVSELLGETLAGDLHERLSQDLCGLAHTVRLSHAATFELTKRRGKEWSCYNGAVRLFWPLRVSNNDYRAHPLWTYDKLLLRADNEVQARDRFRGLISSRILEASTFVADDNAFRRFEDTKISRIADQARAVAAAAGEGNGDFQALANSYAAENDALRAKVSERNREIEVLRDNVEALNIALRSSPAAPQEVVDEAPPQTVEEAVAIARRTLGDVVVIAPETDGDVAGLNPSAGPPDKILRYLQTLGVLAQALKNGTVGNSVPVWLREHGVECSVDSETTKNSREGRYFRLRTIHGERVECEFHAKPSDGVSPDRCVRIYFATATLSPFVKVGYIGRHAI